MSWYQDKVNLHPSPPQNIYGKKMSLALTLTNLNSAADEEKIIKALQNLKGISKVTVNLPRKNLFISFNYEEIRVETILYTLSKLGYHYHQHKCGGCRHH